MSLRILHGLVASGAGVLALAFAVCGMVRADEPQTNKNPFRPLRGSQWSDELKKKYPFESVAPRLEYEKKREVSKDAVILTDEGKKRLDKLEELTGRSQIWNLRTESLAELHAGEVKEFVGRKGFGRGRMIAPSPQLLELPPTGSIAFAPAPAKEPNVGPSVALEEKDPARTSGSGMPSKAGLTNLHQASYFDFVNFSNLGLVKDREHVAGFRSHQFTRLPEHGVPDGKATTRWLVRRLELVSLLKHEKPVVYLSDNLPKMDELKAAPTRALSPFEDKALKALRNGEDLIHEANVNQIRLLGSMRATKTCMACHNVERGELLGAFTYILQREKPVDGGK